MQPFIIFFGFMTTSMNLELNYMKASVSQKTPRLKNPKKKYKFSGHQTFVFRYGWLEKGVRGVAEYGNIFSREDAFHKLIIRNTN